ncbi:putative MFS transporter [Actinoplanes missouriensis 431]|uniref:Putative MFS transporter n=1 Tax=Actinoplanes missouriensis (strain ATCC 14538 / DSM 43046 / CBS 188.64 / JCM 3121 / NBRC 102363 / NCIMB 12654 / NRRL B-3342 / UNCC 431) TaxID=512565 RepID=I0H7U0_ACTM4|nr:MFS transporter [Actinoplanes missouriensis]BAL89077.1 putative MFS transporter [Actinoplanes missouriensis 431]
MAHVAVLLAFAANGVLFGTWTPRIPSVQAGLGLDDGRLGLALLAPALGSVGSMLLTGVLVQRFGAGRVMGCALVGFSVTLPLIGVAPSLWWLFAALLVWGAAMGSLDVSMNAAGLGVQRELGRPVLSGFHAAFSAGGLVGALAGSLAAGAGVPVGVHLAVAGALGLAVTAVVARIPVPDPAVPEAGAPAPEAPPGPGPAGIGRVVGPLLRNRALALLALLAFAGLLAEGAAADWSAVYLTGSLGASAGLAGAGFVAFSVTMTAGRLVGDRVVATFGPVRTVRVAAATAALTLAAALLAGQTWAALAGFAVLGAGLAVLVPVIFTAAAERTTTPATAVAGVSTCGYLGFIAGPPLIGGFASLTSLSAALWLVVALTAVVALLAPVTHTAARTPRPAPSRSPAR